MALTWTRGASAGRYLADTDECGGTRYLVVKTDGGWLLRVLRTEVVSTVTVTTRHTAATPVEEVLEDTLRDAKAVAASYDALRDCRNARMGAARTTAYGLDR